MRNDSNEPLYQKEKKLNQILWFGDDVVVVVKIFARSFPISSGNRRISHLNEDEDENLFIQGLGETKTTNGNSISRQKKDHLLSLGCYQLWMRPFEILKRLQTSRSYENETGQNRKL